MSGLPTPTDRPEIAYPIKATKNGPITNNPNDLQQGHFGIQTESAGGNAWYVPIADNASDPKPNPIKLNISNAKMEALVGTVDGVNKVFTVPSGPVDDNFGFVSWNGRWAHGDYSIVGDTVTFSVAPALGSELWIMYNMTLSGPGLAPIQHLITVSPAGGDFDSIKDAIDSITDNDENNRYAVQVGPGVYTEDSPIQGKSYVSVEAIGDLQTVRVVAGNPNTDLFTMVDLFTVTGVVPYGVTGASNYAFNHSVAGLSAVTRCPIVECTNGVLINHSSADVTVDSVGFRNLAATTTDGVRVMSGKANISDLTRESGTMTTLIRCEGASSDVTIDGVNSSTSGLAAGIVATTGCSITGHQVSIKAATDGIVADGGSVLKINGASIINCTNDGLRVGTTGTGTDITIQGVNIEGSGNLDLNIECPTCIVSGSGKVPMDKIYKEPGAKIIGSFIDLKEGDEADKTLGEKHIGIPEDGAELCGGEGDSYTRGMMVWTEDDDDPTNFIDVSVAARSASASTFTFPGVGSGNAIYIASSLKNDTDFLAHYGIKAQVQTAADYGSGEIVIEYWNGSAWTEVNGAETLADAKYFPYAKNYFGRTGSYHIRYNPLLAIDSWTKNDPVGLGTNYYWARFRIVGDITTAPIFEQFKLHTNHFENNKDGWGPEFFGTSRPERQLPLNLSLGVPLEGAMQNQTMYISQNVGVGGNNNKFTAVTDILGVSGFLPIECDTSAPLTLEWSGHPNATGSHEWTVRWAWAKDGDPLTYAEPGAPIANSNVVVVTKSVTLDQLSIFSASLDISEMITRRDGGFGDTLWISIQPTVLPGNFTIGPSQIKYTAWCQGGHV
jgi:hypothetical protein